MNNMQNNKEFKSKVIKSGVDLPGTEICDYDEFEDWEVYYDLLEKKDYKGLLQYREERANKFPDDPDTQYYLGEAYVLNGEYEKAILFLSDHHESGPENPNFKHVILDALFALGKSEDDFKWVIKPKRKPQPIGTLHIDFMFDGYLLFTAEDLLKAIVEDKRFIVGNPEKGAFAEVKVARKTANPK